MIGELFSGVDRAGDEIGELRLSLAAADGEGEWKVTLLEAETANDEAPKESIMRDVLLENMVLVKLLSQIRSTRARGREELQLLLAGEVELRSELGVDNTLAEFMTTGAKGTAAALNQALLYFELFKARIL